MYHSLIICSATKSHLLVCFQVLAIIKRAYFFFLQKPSCYQHATGPRTYVIQNFWGWEWKQGDRVLQLSVRTHCSKISNWSLHMNPEKILKDPLYFNSSMFCSYCWFSVFMCWHIWIFYISIFSYLLQLIFYKKYIYKGLGISEIGLKDKMTGKINEVKWDSR